LEPLATATWASEVEEVGLLPGCFVSTWIGKVFRGIVSGHASEAAAARIHIGSFREEGGMGASYRSSNQR
jgi:hypothetical protein